MRNLPAALERGRPVTIDFEGQSIATFEGEPVAVALFATGTRVLGRSPKYHRPRGLFCLDGHCGSCLLRVDGRPNVRSCMVPAREGLRCERQNAFPDAELDLLQAADWLFPKGMDHHRLMTGSRLGNELFVKLVRQMGGSGTLPDRPPSETPVVRNESVDVCVVGAGPAGLAAATAVAEARPGMRVVLIDEQDHTGGSLLAEPGGVELASARAAAAVRAGVRLWSCATAIAFYPEDGQDSVVADGPPGLLAVVTAQGLVRLAARRFLYATGSYDQNLPFPDNDRPGIISARACGRLVFRWGIRPAPRVIVVGDGTADTAFLARLYAGLDERGIAVQTVTLDQAQSGVGARGAVIAVATRPAPASELLRQHGAELRLDVAKGGFAPPVGPTFESTVAGVFAVGDVTGFRGTEIAYSDGRLAGVALAATL